LIVAKNGRPLLPPNCRTADCPHTREVGKGYCTDCLRTRQRVNRQKRKALLLPQGKAGRPRIVPKVRILGCPPGWPSAARSRQEEA